MSERIVLVPPAADLATGAELARSLAGRGAVRLIGHGATLDVACPVESLNVARAELGDYVVGSPIDQSRDVRASIGDWLEEVFGGIVPSGRGKALYGAASSRLFQSAIDAVPFVVGISNRHPAAHIHVTDNNWPGAWMLAEALAPTGGSVVSGGRGAASGVVAGAARFAAVVLARLSALQVSQVRRWLRSDGARRTLARRQGGRQPASPGLWVTLPADSPRVCRHLIEGLVAHELARGTSLGILLTRGELGDLEVLLPDCAQVTVESVVVPDRADDLLRGLARSASGTVRAAWRVSRIALANHPRDLRAPGFDLSRQGAALASLVTTDLSRAVFAAIAAERLASRHDLRGACVVHAESSTATTSAADLVLQSHGARTVDARHGGGSDFWMGSLENQATLSSRFSVPDATIAAALSGKTSLVAGMPWLVPSAKRVVDMPRVLVVSNYLHRDALAGGRFPLTAFQDELLRIFSLLRETAVPHDARWRPHPSDEDELLERASALLRDVTVSRGHALDEDLRWADVTVVTPSTVMLEAMAVGAPVFLHVPPEVRDGPNARAFDAERRFFRAADGASRIASVLDGIGRGEDVTAPERRARKRLFGPGGKPIALSAALRRERLLR